jgi:hypothetical protein
MCLGFRRFGVRSERDRAGPSTFVLDTDLAFDRGSLEGRPDYGCDKGDSDRDADCGSSHVERAVS